MRARIDDVEAFWNENPCGSTLSSQQDRLRYFDEIECKRYRGSDDVIPQIARFEQFQGRDVLEIGCGLGTDGAQFARHGARYAGVDLTVAAARLAREQFGLRGLSGAFAVADAERLPFADNSFDHIYSFGVIHHSPDTEAIVRQMYRVLRPGGTVCVMVYNRSSINYHIEIMVLRRLLRLLLYPRVMPGLIARLTGLDEAKLRGHRAVMLSGTRMTAERWISINTDGPQCPLAKVYDRRQALRLFHGFANVRTEVWYFDRTHWPLLGRLIPDAAARWLGRRWGWLRIIYATKP